MLTWQFIIQVIYPFYFLVRDIEQFYKRFSKDSKIVGLIATGLAVSLYIGSRYLLYVINTKLGEPFIRDVIVSKKIFNTCSLIIDMFLWTIVSRLDSKEEGLGIIRVSLLFGIEVFLILPLTLLAYTFVVQLFPNIN